MRKLFVLFLEALKSTSQKPSWWILALGQVTCLFLLGKFGRPNLLFGKNLYLFLLAFFVLPCLCSALWLEAAAIHTKKIQSMTIKIFFLRCLNALLAIILILGAVLVLRLTNLSWLFFILFSSVIAGTAVLSMLCSVLLGMDFIKSSTVAVDAWKKRISLPAIAAFLIILSHGAAYAFGHSALNILKQGEFSVFPGSATIWMPIVLLGLAIAFAAASLNYFLVVLFLETVKPEKEDQSLRQAVYPQTNI